MGNRQDNTDLAQATRITAVLHMIVPLILLAFMAYGVPRFTRMLDELQAELPSATKIVLGVSSLVQRQVSLLVVVLGCLFAVDIGIYSIILRSSGRPAARAWSTAVLSVQAILLVGCVLALFLPLLKLLF